MKEQLIARGVPAQQVAVIPHGSLALESRDPVESRRALGIPENAKVVLFFGFIWTGKGLERLLSAFRLLSRRVPDAFLYIGGYTRLRRWGVYVKYLQLRSGPLRRLQACEALRRLRARRLLCRRCTPPRTSSRCRTSRTTRRSPALSIRPPGWASSCCARESGSSMRSAKQISPDLVVDPHSSEEWAHGLERLLVDSAYAAGMRTKIRGVR